MRAVRTHGTAPELDLRRELHRRGLRYRVNHRAIESSRGRADIAFTRAKVAIFVDGCFWHGCPQHATTPASNTDWWVAKIRENQERDQRATGALAAEGWRVVRVWEHDDPVVTANMIERLVRSDHR
jgi:DNA mismatch endonuclease (patch repair protein)